MSPKPTTLKILDWVSLILLAVATYMVFFFAPMEAVMGNVQRVFYFHVATGWVGFLSFFVAVVIGIIYLRTNDLKWDVVGLDWGGNWAGRRVRSNTRDVEPFVWSGSN